MDPNVSFSGGCVKGTLEPLSGVEQCEQLPQEVGTAL